MKFEVLAGVHSEGGKIFRKGEVVDSISDLDRFNPVGIPPKFRLMPDSTEPTHMTTHNVKATEPKKRTVIVKPKRVIKTADTPSEE